jgi:hypothetical protein
MTQIFPANSSGVCRAIDICSSDINRLISHTLLSYHDIKDFSKWEG